VARLQADGSLDLGFTPVPLLAGFVRALAVQPDGKVWVGGDSTSDTVPARIRIARFNPDGSIDPGFQSGGGAGDDVFAIALQPDGRVLVGGQFDRMHDSMRRRVARLWGDSGAPAVEFAATLFTVSEVASNALITLRRTGDTTAPATVNEATSDGTATAGTDYTPQIGTITWLALMNTWTFAVPVVNDGVAEGVETVNLVLSNAQGAALGVRSAAVLEISDAVGNVGFQLGNASVSVTEGQPSGTLNVYRSGPSSSLATVDFHTVDGSAIAGQDYEAQSGTITFNPGDTVKPITVRIQNDGLQEGTEMFTVVLSNPTGGASLSAQSVGTVSIVDNERGFGFSAASYAVAENVGLAVVTVERNWDTNGSVSVSFATANDSALDGRDYLARSGTLVLGPTESNKIFTVPILNNGLVDGNRALRLTLSGPAGIPLGSPTTAMLTIVDNDRGIEFVVTNVMVAENTGSVSVAIRRGDDGTNDLTVRFATTNGTATAGEDYTAQTGTVVLQPGEVNHVLTLPILEDNLIEIDEAFGTVLTEPGPGAVLGPQIFASVTILDNDGRPGALDGTFDAGLEAPVQIEAMARQPDGKVIVVGSAPLNFGGLLLPGIARLNPDGSRDRGYNPQPMPHNGIYAVAVQSDGKAVFGGVSDTNPVFRLNTNGSLDTTFQPSLLAGSVRRVVIQPDGKLLCAGQFTLRTTGLGITAALGRLTPSGSPDPGFAPLTNYPPVDALALQDDGKILVTEYTSPLLRLNVDGFLDETYHPQVCCKKALALQADGKLLVAYNGIVSGPTYGVVERWLADGTSDASFKSIEGGVIFMGGPWWESVLTLVSQPDGRVVVGGSFLGVWGSRGSLPGRGIARLDGDGTLDNSFDPGEGTDDRVTSVLVLPDGKILIGGYFNRVGGVLRRGVARLHGGWSFKFLTAPQPGTNQVKLTLASEPWRQYVLEGSTNLADWRPLSTNSVPGYYLEFTDTNTASFPRRFYRALPLAP
jgi:uncharacterized delta-60 repeat protein